MELPEFKLIVAGGRDYRDYPRLEAKLFELAETVYADKAISIISGAASGADGLAIKFAGIHNVMLYTFPANWDQYGKRAGFLRNEDMANFSHGLLAFWDGNSRGTKHMIEQAQRHYLDVHIERY